MSNPEYLDKTGLDELVSQTKSYVGNKVSKKIDKPVNVLPGKVLQTDSHGDPIWGEAIPQADITQAVDNWLEENIDPGSAVTLDPTLTQQQAAAQAKAVGDAIDSLKENLVVVDDNEPESDDNVIWVPETPENEVVVPTISELNEVAGTVAKDYADLTFPIKAGTLCRHDYGLYAAKQDISTQEAWTSGHWSAKTNIADKLDSLSSAFDNALDAMVDVGFDNNFDEVGYINNGVDQPSTSFVRTSEYYDCSDWETVYVRHQNGTAANFVLVFYNNNKEFIRNEGTSQTKDFSKPENAVYYRAYKDINATGLDYVSNEAPTNPVDYSTQYKLKESAYNKIIGMQTDGINCFDSDFDSSGYINNGADASATGFVRTTKYYDCSGWDFVFVRHANSPQLSFTLVFYNKNKVFIRNEGTSTGKDIKKPAGAYYFRAYKNASSTGNTYVSYALPDVDSVDYNYYEKQMVLSDFVPVTLFDFLNFKRRILNSSGKTVVNFGDSIYGNTQDDTSVSGILSAMSGYDCVNAGFGGCQMSLHNITGWQPFSMCNLVDAIVTGDWSSQDASIAQASSLNLPYYFATTIATLKAIDFSNVYMVTIEYGTNDWSSGKPLDNESDPFDKGTYAGALRYSIKTLQTAYPKLKIVVQNPTVQINPTTGETSDTITNTAGLTLVQYVEAENSACKQYKIPVINAYYESGFNVYNHDYYFASAGDDVHLGYNGRYRLAEMVASFLLAHYRG